MPRKVIPVDPSNWRLHAPVGAENALSHAGLPDNEWDALLRAAPGEEVREDAESRERSQVVFDDPTWAYQHSLSNAVNDALASMTEDCALVVSLIYGQSMSLREVEFYTGIPKTTVARRRDEGKRMLLEAFHVDPR